MRSRPLSALALFSIIILILVIGPAAVDLSGGFGAEQLGRPFNESDPASAHTRTIGPGRTLHVSGSDPTCGGKSQCFPTIQSAITEARPGDRVLIQPGRYSEQL